MRKKTAWILIFFMLFTFLGQAAKAKELVPRAAGRYSAGREWRLTSHLTRTGKIDCREETRYENFPGKSSTMMGSGLRAARGLQILLGLLVLYFMILAGRKECRRGSPFQQEPVRMRAVRYMHFAYGL